MELSRWRPRQWFDALSGLVLLGFGLAAFWGWPFDPGTWLIPVLWCQLGLWSLHEAMNPARRRAVRLLVVGIAFALLLSMSFEAMFIRT